MELQGLPALVTGGGSGMGAATARALAAKGMRVAVADISGDKAEAVATEIGGIGLTVDVTDEQAALQAFARAREAHGPVRVLVNCAGIASAGRVAGRDGPHPLDLFERTIKVNLIGSFNMARLAAVEMSSAEPLADGERGLIVNTASVAAFEGQIGQAAYAASKGGVVSMTLPMARELARFGIRVVTIAPGLIETPMMANMSQEVYESLVATTLFPHRLGRADEYAKLVLAIADNQMINGETIRLDGALRMQPK